jgi:phospholipid transport system substrate-binding protein
MRPAKLLSILLAVAALALPSPVLSSGQSDPAAAGARRESPVAVVETLHDILLESMRQGADLDFQGRFELIEPVVDLTFDIELMGSKSVGRHWKQLNAEDKAIWVSKFRSYLAASFAGNFNEYDGESFETLGEKPAARETRIVLTKLRVPKSDDVIFNYRVKQSEDGWQIIDIYLKGTVSELALRRSDFSTTLKKDGFGELSAAIDRKIEQFREEADG